MHVLLLTQCMQIWKMALTCIAYVTKCLAAFPHEQRDGEFVDVKEFLENISSHYLL